MTEENILIRKVVPNKDLIGLVQLYNEVWPNVHYDKQAKTEFVILHSKGVCYCAEQGGKIRGSRTSVYQNLFFNDRKIECVQLGDSCVHPSLQGKGLFQQMNRAFLEDFFNHKNGELIFNISVAASRRSYEKLGWKYIESLMSLRKFTRPFHLLYSARFNPRNISIPVEWDSQNTTTNINEQFFDAREQIMKEFGALHIRYNRDVFNWRLKSKSGIKIFNGGDLGCIVYKLGHRGRITEILIGEIFLREYNEKNFKKLLKYFIKEQKPDILSVWVSVGHPLHSWYVATGFIHNPKQKYLHHGVRVETEEMKMICYKPENWAISSLDIDTF